MITRKDWSLILLGAVISTAYGAPLNGTSVDFRGILSNETRWPFIKACISDSSSSDEFLCPEYVSAKENVSQCIGEINDTEILSTPVETFTNISLFCNVSFTGSVNRNVTHDFQRTCELVCIEARMKSGKVGNYIKPFCRLISWIRSNCSAPHDSILNASSSVVTAPNSSVKQIHLSGRNDTVTQTSGTKAVVNLPTSTQTKLNSLNSTTTTSNFPESVQKETLTVPKQNATTPSTSEQKADVNFEEIASPVVEVKSNNTKTIETLPSAPTKKTSATTTNSGSDTVKTQNDEPVAANNSEQINTDNAEQEQEQSKIEDESSYEETGDNIKETDQFGKNAEDYQNLDSIQKKPELDQESINAHGKDWIPQKSKPQYYLEPDDSGSNFFTYFLFGMFLCIVLYVVYHNKSKILALVLEGRRTSSSRSGSKRKHTAAYRKLDTNLEEAITSSASGRTSQIIY